jgi:hypothetical protein
MRLNNNRYLRSEVPTAVTMKSTVFWVVMLCCSEEYTASIFRVKEFFQVGELLWLLGSHGGDYKNKRCNVMLPGKVLPENMASHPRR